ncbi:hypothetical protein DFQ27_002553, partial [Actinomortierella ambigua]
MSDIAAVSMMLTTLAELHMVGDFTPRSSLRSHALGQAWALASLEALPPQYARTTPGILRQQRQEKPAYDLHTAQAAVSIAMLNPLEEPRIHVSQELERMVVSTFASAPATEQPTLHPCDDSPTMQPVLTVVSTGRSGE